MSGWDDSPIPLLGGLGLALAGAWWIGEHTAHNIIPWDVDDSWSSPRDFYATRSLEPNSDIELGGGWTSVRDPGAAFSVSWIAQTGEVVAFRHQAHASRGPSPIGLTFLGVGGVPFMNRKAEGMKALGTAQIADIRASSPSTLRDLPDGLDRLVEVLELHFDPPPAPPGEGDRAPARTRPVAPTDERHERLITAIPSIASLVALVVLVIAVTAGGEMDSTPLWPLLWALAVAVVVGGLAMLTSRFVYGKTLVRRSHRSHAEARGGGTPPLRPRARRDPGA